MVAGQTLRLEVGTKLPAVFRQQGCIYSTILCGIQCCDTSSIRAFIVVQTQCMQRCDDALEGSGNQAVLIGVLYTENEVASMLAGEEP